MTLTIDLLRHGETEGGARFRGDIDDCLTPRGWQQMWDAVGGVTRYEMIVTSPLLRCADFARALAERHSASLRIDARWREMHFGAWEGRTAAEVMDTAPDDLANFWQDPWNHGPPGGEPLQQLQARVLAAWQDVVSQNRTALVICHGGPLRVILCHVYGLPIEKLLQIEMPHGALHRVVPPTDLLPATP